MINNLSLDQYSTILAIGSIIIMIAIIIHYIMNKINNNNKLNVLLNRMNNEIYIKIIFILSLLSLISAIIYEFIYHTPVCPLCWWQRVFIIPTIFLSFLQIKAKIKNEVNIILLSVIGLIIAIYHYYLHYATLVLGWNISSPCSGNTFLANCAESPILIFGTITIPFMSMAFFFITIYLAIQSFRKNYNTK